MGMLRGLAVASAIAAFAGGAQAQTVVVHAGRMVDVLAGKVASDQAIVIENERIVSVGPWGAAHPPAGAKVIDLSSMTVTPGLIDTHTHVTDDPTTSPYDSYAISYPREATIGVRNARITLLAGVTTMRNVGASGYSDFAVRDGINAGDFPGPRIFASGPLIGATGGHCDDNHLAPQYNYSEDGVADGVDAVRLKVRTNIKYGADLIKYCGTGGVFSVGDKPGAQQFSQEEANAIVAEAHLAGRTVAVHAHGADGIKVAIRAGADSIEHASLIDDEGLRMAKKAGTFLSMDIYNTDYTQAEGLKNGVPEDEMQKDRDIGEIQRENFRKAVKMGMAAKMTFGTDAGVYPHGDNAKQLAVMVRYGMTPMQALQAATENGAALLKKTKDIGAIAPGRYADLVAVVGDPLSDIRLMEKPAFVMKGGQVYRGDAAACAAAPAAWPCQ